MRGISVVKSTHQWGSGVEGLWWASIHMGSYSLLFSSTHTYTHAVLFVFFSFFFSFPSYQSFLMAYNGAARTAAFHWFSFSFLFFFFRLFCLLLLAFCLIVNVFKERNATQYHIGSSFLASILFLFLFAHFWLYHSHTGSAAPREPPLLRLWDCPSERKL